jgi:hypothetical protein
MVDYQIEDVFTTNPALKGWIQFGDININWDGIEKVGGHLGADDISRYVKYLGKTLTQANQMMAAFTFVSEPKRNDHAIFGFFDVNTPIGKQHCFGMILNATGVGTSHANVYIAYSDGTIVQGNTVYPLNSGDKYFGAIRYIPEDGKAYLEIYDFLTQQLLFQDEIILNTSKSLSLNQIGMSLVDLYMIMVPSLAWMYDMKAVAELEPVVYSSLYCTPEEARKMTNLDAVQDMTDDMLAQIERIYAMPQVDARFRSEGYSAPFLKGEDAPPLIRAVTALLTAAYACKKSYIGHAPSESPNYEALLEEVNKIWDDLLKGKLELINVSGEWIERTKQTSTDMLSTTAGKTNTFSLNNFGALNGACPCE